MLAETKSLKVRMHDVLRQFPEGLTSAELRELFPDEGWNNAVHATVSALKGTGHVAVINKKFDRHLGRKVSVFTVTNKRLIDGRQPPMRRAKPTGAGYEARLAEAAAKIAELEAWKADAIARFPVLGIPPLLAEARKRVAAILSESGDASGAEQVKAGNRDGTAIVKAVFATLQDLAA